MTESTLPTMPPTRARTLARIAAQSGQDIAHLHLLGIEAFKAMGDSIQRYLARFETTSPNLYQTISLQINAACQMTRADDPTATRRQLIARAACMEKFIEAQDAALQNGLAKDEIKAARQHAIAETAAFFGLGNKKAVKARSKAK